MSLHPLSIIADRDRELHAAVSAFATVNEARINHPGRAFGQCYDLASDLSFDLARAGIDAKVVSSHSWDPQPEALGMTDRLNAGCDNHYWTYAKSAGLQWAVDMSATQYGYAGPVAALAPIDERPTWASPVDAVKALDGADLLQNRIDAGIPDEYLDPEAFDVWLDPSGELHILDDPQSAFRRWRDWDMRNQIDDLWARAAQLKQAA